VFEVVVALGILFRSDVGVACGVVAKPFGKTEVGLLHRDDGGDPVNEMARAVDGLARHVSREVGTGAGVIIGDRFEIVSAAEESPDLIVHARVVSLTKRANSPLTPPWVL
jgi:hypothetical protein